MSYIYLQVNDHCGIMYMSNVESLYKSTGNTVN